MNLYDFLPKYPLLENEGNPYGDESFNDAIYHKKEFYENRLGKTQEFPREPGLLTKHQKTIARYLSSHTPYDRLLLAHSMGTGKTCSIIGAIEQIRNEPDSGFDGAVIFVKGDALEENFKNELLFQCTTGHYIPANYADRTDISKKKSVSKEIEKFYSIQTFEKFSSELRKQYTDEGIRKKFSNKIIVIDEVHNIRQYGGDSDDAKKKKKKDGKRYNEFYRLLHNVDNCKIVLMSGTPMKDGVEEIASIMNLLLPEEKKLPTGQRFLEEYTDENDGVFMVRDDKREELKTLFKGYVSFLKGESDEVSDIPKQFVGKTNIGTLKHLVVSAQKMSSFQTENYLRIFDSEFGKRKKGDEIDDLEVADEKSAAYSKARQASLFVYPGGISGTEGFKKYIEIVEVKNASGKVANKSYRLSSELRKALSGKTTEETLKNISKHSCVYAEVIKRILETKGNCFVYSYFIEGSGAILFGLLLGLFDFSRSNGTEVSGGLRYGILAHASTKASTQDKILKLFNSTKNAHGDFIKVVIGGRRVSEGITFKNVIAEFILTPNWNYSETSQVIARGIRLGSHRDLVELGESPEVKIYQTVALPKTTDNSPTNSLQKSIDLIMYQTSEDKDIAIRTMMRLLMECAFDCALNFLRNYAENGEDYSRECDYTICKYVCDGVDEKEVEFGLQADKLDYSTFQLYYANEKMARVRKRVEELFRINPRLDMDSIEKNLGEEFTLEEIHASLAALEKENESKERDYQTFLRLYTRTPVKTIMNGIENLFRKRTEIMFDEIVKMFEGHTEFEILVALQELISNNIVIYDKYALPCYLREDHNHYFLVNSLLANSKVSSSIYVENPHEVQRESFGEIVKKEYNRALPNIIGGLCKKAENKKEFAEALAALPIKAQQLFIEEALNAKKKTDAVKAVLEIYASYIKKVGKEYVITLIPENLRCKGKDDKNWYDCGDEYQEQIQKSEEEKLTKIKENPYGIIGLHNPQKDTFCLVDIRGEKSGKAQRAQKGRDTEDKRISYTGKVCNAGGWKIHQLLEIAALRLKIPAPDDFMPDATKEELREAIRAEDFYSSDEKDYASLIDNKMLKNMSMEALRSAVYWGTTKSRSIKPLCVAIREWLEKEGLVQIDNQCGVQGKKKGAEAKGAKGTKQYRIEKLVPNKDEERFKSFSKEITAMSKQTLGMPDTYKPPINNTVWYLLLSRTSKVVGFLNINSENQIISACVEKNYRKKGGGVEAMRQATEYVKEEKGVAPVLVVKNRDKNATKNIRTYTTLGFKEERTDETFTYMKFSN